MSRIPLIVIAGPTASGKTALSIELAKRLDGEIVSADSVQIYKYMDIGSAKPTRQEMDGVPHYLIDEITPDIAFSVADYTKSAHTYIADIHARGKLPIMAGGTGLYINSVVDDISFQEMDTNYELREELEQLAKERGTGYLLELLKQFDPVSAARLHENNLRRVIRAIEVYKMTGIPISVHQENTKQTQSRYQPIMFAVKWDRDVLYDRINKRVDSMFEMGLIDEVKSILEMGYRKTLSSMKGIGYKEVADYLRGFSTYDDMINLIKRDSRRYAKRQLTWFRRDKRIHWLAFNESITDTAVAIIEAAGVHSFEK